MCARRNPDSHPRLIGPTGTFESTAPTWRGNYPKGLTPDEFLVAQSIRSQMWATGCRVADIVEALERFVGTARPSCRATHQSFSQLAEAELHRLIANHWKSLKWHRQLTLEREFVFISDNEWIDFIATDPQHNVVCLILLQQNTEDTQVAERLASIVTLSQELTPQSLTIEGVIIACSSGASSLRNRANEFGLRLFTIEIEALRHIHVRDEKRIKVRVRAVR